jgi:hypothetical protein
LSTLGEWKDGVADGQGEIKFENQDFYQGGFKNGKWTGHGSRKIDNQILALTPVTNQTITSPFGDKVNYSGQLANGLAEGYGIGTLN